MNKKSFILILLSFIYYYPSYGRDNPVEGKTYDGIVSEACKSFKDGGCMITTYHSLIFKKDSVDVKYLVKADCDTSQKDSLYQRVGSIDRYSYQVQKKLNSPNFLIRINGYEIGSFEAFSDKLVEFVNDPNYQNSKVYNLRNK